MNLVKSHFNNFCYLLIDQLIIIYMGYCHDDYMYKFLLIQPLNILILTKRLCTLKFT